MPRPDDIIVGASVGILLGLTSVVLVGLRAWEWYRARANERGAIDISGALVVLVLVVALILLLERL